MKLYVGNLSDELTERELRDAFMLHAGVKEVKIVRDKESGQSKGFGFVELLMESDTDAAIAATNEQMLRGRRMRVEIAKPSENGRGRKHGAGGRRSPY